MSKRSMKSFWLPNPIYKALPVAYIVIGLLLLAGVIYSGFTGSSALMYGGVGLLSIGIGFIVHRLRKRTPPS